MIRVLWNIPKTSSWTGGLNYFINLYNGLLSLSERKVEPIILHSPGQLPPSLSECLELYVPHSQSHKRFRPLWFIYKLSERVNPSKSEQRLSKYLLDNNIQLFSHGWSLGQNSPVPALCWIPDFQHRYLSHFFTKTEIKYRDEAHQHIIETAQGVLLSSEDARANFKHFYPGYEHKTHILRFVAAVDSIKLPDAAEVLTRHEIKEPFFYVPNQLWQHKNHGIILEALTLLKSRRKCPLVISTGQTDDYRNQQYFPTFKAKVERAGLKERFRFLGLVDYVDVQVLLRESLCLINPSLFEGWSTTVEEAKSLGKRLILSDINVHKEQSPERGIYFPPNDAETLAAKMQEVLDSYDHKAEINARSKAMTELPGRLRQVGRCYEDIIMKMLQSK